MPHPDLLTDEDLATRHEPKKRYFNQYVCIVAPPSDHDLLCSNCKKVLASKIGDIFYSCCPATFDSIEEAKEAIFEQDEYTGEYIADYLGTFEL